MNYRYLVNQVSRYPCSGSAPLGGSRVVNIFVNITKYIIFPTSNHMFVHFNHYDTFYSNNFKRHLHKDLSSIDNLKPKVQIKDEFIIYIMN